MGIIKNELVDKRPDFIFADRRSGKTTTLIKQAAKTGGTIVCVNRNMAKLVDIQASELGYTIPHAITYDQFNVYIQDPRVRNSHFYFDEYGIRLTCLLDKFIKNLESNNVKTVIIDNMAIRIINDILGSIKMHDMDGKPVRIKIDICKNRKGDSK